MPPVGRDRKEASSALSCVLVAHAELLGGDSPALGLTLVALGGGAAAGRLPGSRPWCVVAPDVLAAAGQNVVAGSAVLVSGQEDRLRGAFDLSCGMARKPSPHDAAHRWQ